MIYPIGIPIEVCDKFVELARDVRTMHFRRYSADAILHRIRWHFQIERGRRGFKCNNNWTATLARWLMKECPDEFEGFFETREKTGKAEEWIESE